MSDIEERYSQSRLREERQSHKTSGSCNSILWSFLIAPWPMLVALTVLGWNEHRTVCDSRQAVLGARKVHEVGCDSSAAGDGEFVILSCNVSKAGLSPSVPSNSSFATVLGGYVGTGLSAKVEMLQCVETALGDGVYSYAKEWRRLHIDSKAFQAKDQADFLKNCNAENPSWPEGLPSNGARYEPTVAAGAFQLPSELVRKIPLLAPVTGSVVPEGWTLSDDTYVSTRWAVASGGPAAEQIGTVRVSFSGTDWSNPMVTVIAENRGGFLQRWTMGDSWLCDGFSIAEVRLGEVSKERVFDELGVAASAGTTAVRIACFVLAWLAAACFCGPLEVANRSLQYTWTNTGKSPRVVTCAVACPLATACVLLVIGTMWVVLRPLAGIPMILAFLCPCCGLIVSRAARLRYRRQDDAVSRQDVESAHS